MQLMIPSSRTRVPYDSTTFNTKHTNSSPHTSTSLKISWKKYQSVTQSFNFMFSIFIPFSITISHHIKFIVALVTKYQHIKTVI